MLIIYFSDPCDSSPEYDTEDSDIVFGENALVCFSKYFGIFLTVVFDV